MAFKINGSNIPFIQIPAIGDGSCMFHAILQGFNKSYIEQKLGRSVIPGDVIKPAFQNQKYDLHLH